MTRVSLDDPARDDGLVEIDRCNRCGGIFLELFDGEPIGLARGVVASTPARSSDRPARPARCPDCETPMVERPYLDEGPMLWRCETCLAVFVSRDRLEELASTRVRRNDEAAPPSWLDRLLALFGSR